MRHSRRWWGLLLIGVMLLGMVGPVAAQGNEDPPERDYWPTEDWQTADPAEQGMDADLLAAAGELIQAAVEAGESNIDSLLVVRGGYLVAEYYYQDYDGTTPHQLRSATKSVMSALVGIALRQGFLESVDQPLVDFFPEALLPEIDPVIGTITIQNLLTMRSGLLWNETGRTVPYVFGSSNWILAAFTLPIVSQPGEYWNYSSADAHMLSAIVNRATGTLDTDYVEDVLFGPLGITKFDWPSDPFGYPSAGGGLSLTPRDMAKFGYLYLNNGWWDGKSIVPADWVAESVQEHATMDYDGPDDVHYGYLWWLVDVNGYTGYTALGYAGQRIYVFPTLDLVIVATGNVEQPEGESFNLLSDYVVPAILDAPPVDIAD